MNGVSIVFLVVTVLFILVPTIISICKKDGVYMMFSIASILTFMIFCFTYWPDPTTKDVRDGKAIYVTEKNIGLGPQGDTLYNYDTYSLEWLPEWKYDRKHEVQKIK